MAERRGGPVRQRRIGRTDSPVRGGSVPLRRACVLGVMTLALWAALGGTAAAGAVTSGSVLTSTKAAIAQQTGVHVVFRANRASSATTEKIVADVGVTTGQETVSEGRSHVAIRVTPGYGYVSGDSSGLTAIFGLTADQAKKVGSDWVSWKAGTSQYANLKADVTFAAVTALLPGAKGTRLSTGLTNGANVYVLKWTAAASSSTPMLSNTLTVSASGQSLPIEQVSTASGGTKATTQLSGWGELVPASAPPAASTITSTKITH
jgi:hypothetical protein